MKKPLFLVSAGIAVLMAQLSMAQSFSASQFIGIDRDADNLISPAETTAFRIRYFDTLDQNGDGTVEFEEYVQANNLRSAVSDPNAAVRIPDEYREADANSDTKLTKQEFTKVGEKRFTELDANSDGMISREEFQAPGL